MHSRRPAAVSSLSLVLPHPPLPRRSSSSMSSQDSRPSPRTPRSSCGLSTPMLFRLDSSAPRSSTDSWNSSTHDGGEDDMEWEWKPEQISLLAKTLDTLPSHLMTPFNGAVPPANLLDKIARSIAAAKGPLDWPQSVRVTRAKLVELARIRAKESEFPEGRCAFDMLEEDVLQATTNIPKKRLYRQSSMDFLQSEKLKEGAINRLSTRLQRADRVISNPAYHPYARPGSRSPSPPPVASRPFSLGDAPSSASSTSEMKPRNSTSSLSLSCNRVPRLRRSTTMISNLPAIQAGVASNCTTGSSARSRPLQQIKRSESFSSPSMNGLGHSLKRAPSFGASSIRSHDSSRMSVDDQKENAPKMEMQKELDVYPSSDEEERIRSRRAKKPRTRSSSPSGEKPKKPNTSQSTTSKSAGGSKLESISPPGSVRVKKAAKAKPMRTSSMFGAELPNPQPDPAPPASIPAPLPLNAAAVVQTPMISTHKTLRRVKTTTFPPRPSRRISFGSLAVPIEEGFEGTGSGLGSAFQMN